MLGYAYHLPKLYDYVDIFNLVEQGVVINAHMAFDHLTAPYLTYSRIISMPLSSSTTTPTREWLTDRVGPFLPAVLTSALNSPDWRVFALANSLHHAIMYASFSRLALGIGTDVLWMFATNGGKESNDSVQGSSGFDQESTNRAVSILLLTRHVMLYWDERSRVVLADQERKRRKVERDEKSRLGAAPQGIHQPLRPS
ncbi:hypothetical protein DV738_g3953, partial [Chaetothyriales sp. CBS 135597]